MRILLVEDDHLQRAAARQALQTSLDAEIQIMKTEFEFFDSFEATAANPPSVVILDRMLRWVDPKPNIPAPPDGARENAGLRCAQKLRNDPRTRSVRIIFYSVLERDDSGAYEKFDQLVKDAGFDELIDHIRSGRTN